MYASIHPKFSGQLIEDFIGGAFFSSSKYAMSGIKNPSF
jgi:hypothetical protein